MSQAPRIPILLLKTRSQPQDGYQEYFSSPSEGISFNPIFIPVLSHAPNTTNLSALSTLLRQGTLKDKYGGMIFTSQRAVEAFSSIVTSVHSKLPSLPIRHPDPDFFNDTPFPLYVVGPATATLLAPCIPFLTAILPHLNPLICGEQSGNGAALAAFILNHYNNVIHARKVFTFYEAPRLPFVPLLGAGGENYSRRRLEMGDRRLEKKGLGFLVGETRRDVIPRMLMDEKREGGERIEVDEVEVYRTEVVEGFEGEFAGVMREVEGRFGVVVVVVFSPQGCEGMLRALGVLGEDGRVNERGKGRWSDKSAGGGDGVRYVVATIGPTTRDHLKEKFGFEADVCAKRPSPEGLGEGIREFLKAKGVI